MLLDAEFIYNLLDWQPTVAYQVRDGQGDLIVTQPDTRLLEWPRNVVYRWGLRFCNHVPLSLAVKLGNGDATLDLGDLTLTTLEANVANGQLTTEAEGDIPTLTGVSLHTANGKTTLSLQGRYEALQNVTLAAASGKLDIELLGAYPTLKELSAKTMSGSIHLNLGATYDSLEKLEIGSVSGIVDIDLTGSSWQHDLETTLHCVSGMIKVMLPENIGVAAKIKKLSGAVNAPGFRRERGLYVNAAYGQTPVTLYLDIATVSGNVKLLQPRKEELRSKG
jgi:DUF4097 and DUF4098 domain-containing protein YvlB